MDYEIKVDRERVKSGGTIKLTHYLTNKEQQKVYFVRGDYSMGSSLYDLQSKYPVMVGDRVDAFEPDESGKLESADNVVCLKPGETYEYTEEIGFGETDGRLWLQCDECRFYIPESGIVIWGNFQMEGRTRKFVPEEFFGQLLHNVTLFSNVAMRLDGDTLVVCEGEKYSISEFKGMIYKEKKKGKGGFGLGGAGGGKGANQEEP